MHSPLAILALAGLAYAAEPNTNAEQIRGLIAKLAITDAPASPGPVFTPTKATSRTDKRVIAHDAAAELCKFGIEAFPILLNSLHDQRQSIALRPVLPSTVGDACFCIIARQIYAFPRDYPGSYYRTGADGQLHERPYFLKDLFTAANIKEWLAARQGRTLPELQLEVLGWMLAEEERIGAGTKQDEEKYLAPLRAEYAKLKKQNEARKAK